jgi:two-component system response regulator AtoC
MNNKKSRILIIEDDEEMRSLLEDFLKEEGFETNSVGNGSEAFRILVREIFDIVITDIRMPGLTGLDIIPGVRKLQPETNIIVITAFGSEEVHQKSIERGANSYLEKPLRFHELRRMVHELLSPQVIRRNKE